MMRTLHHVGIPLFVCSLALTSACMETQPEALPLQSSASQALERATQAASARNTREAFAALEGDIPGFGGVFIRNGRIHVYLKNLSRADDARPLVTAFLRATYAPSPMAPEPLGSEEILFLLGKYSATELDTFRLQLRELITSAAVEGVVSLGVQDSENRVKVQMSTRQAEGRLRKLALDKGIPADALNFALAPPSVNKASLDNTAFRPTFGGNRVERISSAGCTQTLAVNHYTSGAGFLTASHCTLRTAALDSDNFYQPRDWWFGVDHVGNELLDPTVKLESNPGQPCPQFKYCRNADVTFIQYKSGIGGRVGRILKPLAGPCQGVSCTKEVNTCAGEPCSFEIIGSQSVLLEGQTVHKVGQASGWTVGHVQQPNVDIQIPNTAGFWADQIATYMYSIGGDSGSPVFITTPYANQVKVVGVLWGGYNENYSDVSPMAGMQKDLGAFEFHHCSAPEPYTTDPNHCGGCNRACPGITNGQAVCNNGSCGFQCNAGYTLCNGQCVLLSSNVDNCGACGNVCSYVEGAKPVCSSGRCSYRCNSGCVNCGDYCACGGESCQ